MKLTITQLGTPKTVKTQWGDRQKNYAKASEYGDKFLNYWLSPTTQGWTVGAIIEVDRVEERKYTGADGTEKTSYDIHMPKVDNRQAPAVSDKTLEEIKNILTRHTMFLNELVMEKRKNEGIKIVGTNMDYPLMDETNNAGTGNIDKAWDELSSEEVPF